MEKKIYEKPAMQVEAFIANDYCVNCKEDPAHQFVTYYFECDAGGSQNNKCYVRDGSGNYATIAGNYIFHLVQQDGDVVYGCVVKRSRNHISIVMY